MDDLVPRACPDSPRAVNVSLAPCCKLPGRPYRRLIVCLARDQDVQNRLTRSLHANKREAAGGAGSGREEPDRCYGGHFVLRKGVWWATLDSNQ